MVVDIEAARVELGKQSGMITLLGVVLVFLGILCIGSPLVTAIPIAYIVGAFMFVGGVGQIMYSMRAASWGAGLFGLIGGVIGLVAGLIVLAHPILGLKFMTLLLAAYFIIDGFTRILMSLQMRPVRGWGWAMFCGVVTLMLGLMIWRQWPLSSAWAIGVLVGVNLLLIGWSMVTLGMIGRVAATSPDGETSPPASPA